MFTAMRVLTSLLLNLVLVVGVSASPSPQPASATSQQQQKSQAPDTQAAQASPDEPQHGTDEVAEEDLAPAAVQLDVSKDSPLIQVLYKATRETKEPEILARIAEAKQLVDQGTDLKAVDGDGRTALHWAVFGSSYSTKPKVIVAYESLADDMIQRGVDLNREDRYQDTALDYLLYSPNFEMQTLLVENGATSGFLAAFGNFFDEVASGFPKTETARIATTRKADLAPGATFRIQLQTPTYSDRSRTGDAVKAWVSEPVYNGDRLLIAPGTELDGTVLFAQKAANKYDRPRMVLDFSNILHGKGKTSPLYARVLDVDNSRETVRNNEILGIVQPHVSTKVGLVTAAVSASNPIAGYTLKGIQTIYGLSIRREIFFPEGTDMIVQVVRPSMVKEKAVWEGWPALPTSPELEKLVHNAPMRTKAGNQTLSDPTNLMFIGTAKQLTSAFDEAGWFETDPLNVGSGLKSFQATIRRTGYTNAPVSRLTLQGKPPDYVFQKGLDTLDKRHHIRVWKLGETYDGHEVWIGAATHDIATTNARKGTKWSHRIDPHVDRERDWIKIELFYNGVSSGYAYVDRPHAPKKIENATGDEILTDGRMLVLKLGASPRAVEKPSTASAPTSQPAVTSQ